MCPERTTSCQLRDCKSSRDTTPIKKLLINVIVELIIKEIRFEVWLQADRCTLQTDVVDVDRFVEDPCEQLSKLKIHDFIATKQACFFRYLKEKLDYTSIIIRQLFS